MRVWTSTMYFRSHIGKVEYAKHDSIGSDPWSKTMWHLMCHVSSWVRPSTTGLGILRIYFFGYYKGNNLLSPFPLMVELRPPLHYTVNGI